MKLFPLWMRRRSPRSARPRSTRLQVEMLEDRTLLSSNAIVAENLLAGNPQSEWDVSGAGDSTLQGYATAMSVNVGQTVQFKVTDTALAAYHIDIYRMGYYGGLGARKEATIASAQALRVNQAAPLTDPATGLIDCGNWSVTATWNVPTTAVSGVYFARLVRDDTGGASHVFFVIRDDSSHSDLLFQTSDSTWQAYNSYGGRSLYDNNPINRAYKVSYNRPLNDRGIVGGFGDYNSPFYSEYPMVRWLEANGYDVSYFTDVDSDRNGSLILNHKAFLSVGHDEYWSGGQFANVTAARDAGVNLAFFSGNAAYWKTRWESSIDSSGTPFRTLVCYKETTAGAKIDPTSSWTGTWRDPRFSPPADGGRPENALTGNLYTVDRGPTDIGTLLTVSTEEGQLRFWRNTSLASLAPGQMASVGDQVLGYEFNEDLDNGFRPAGDFDLSTTTTSVTERLLGQDAVTTGAGSVGPGTATHSLTMYRAASGALVFGAGTVQWSWGLDGNHIEGDNVTDPSIQQATVNLFADMGVQPGCLQPGLVAATASTDTIKPTSTINALVNTVRVADTVTITGTATDSGGQVGGVEVSVDGGVSWHKAAGRANWSYSWTPLSVGTFTVLSRATDDSGNTESPAAGIRATVGGANATGATIWGPSVAPVWPTSTDTSAVEVGVAFQPDMNGSATGIRFYKGAGNGGTHVGHLWTASGSLLATVTFSGETASGWQQASFSTPVALTAGTSYVVSYYAPQGHYAADSYYFRGGGVDNGVLDALSNAAAGGNGVFHYGTGGGFPNQSFGATNYWVDVVFNGDASTAAPRIVSQSPAANATALPTTSTVSATFSKSVVANTIGFIVHDASNNAVSGTVSYDDTTHTTTFQPAAALAALTSYTVTVSGASDAFGHSITAPVSWSFTTGTGAGVSIWSASTVPATPSANDGSAVEVGLKFQADVSGSVTGIRFYKGAGNAGTHIGHLWSASGTLLATVTFTGETASGWQQANLSAPVSLTAGTTYVVSYYAPQGHYAGDNGYFSTGIDTGTLKALADGVAAGNGVYLYGSGGFPTQSYNASNYWVDVVFNPAPVGNPPVVVSETPAANATGVSTVTTVSATFNESVQANTISFVLRDPANSAVPASLSYNDATHTATLSFSGPLKARTTYTATVSGATDANGIVMSGPVTWSFTTGGALPPWTQTTAADFGSGTPTGTIVTNSSGGEVQLAPRYQDDFTGSSLAPSWTATSWAAQGGGPLTITVANGILSLGGGAILSGQLANGSPVEGRISFAAAQRLDFGLATGLTTAAGNYWALFSTNTTTNTLYARVNASGKTQTVKIGALPSGFHVYLVKPVATGFQFYVDNVLKTSVAMTFPTGTALRIALSAYGSAKPMQADWVRYASYTTGSTFTSMVFDAGTVVTWGKATWTATVPSGTTLVFETRSGNTPAPDSTWSAWAPVNNGGIVASPPGRYLQYRVTFTTNDPTLTPVLFDIAFQWS